MKGRGAADFSLHFGMAGVADLVVCPMRKGQHYLGGDFLYLGGDFQIATAEIERGFRTPEPHTNRACPGFGNPGLILTQITVTTEMIAYYLLIDSARITVGISRTT